MKLRQVAHSRTGDKGDISNISVIAYRETDYERLRKSLNTERVRIRLQRSLGEAADTGAKSLVVRRYELPRVRALNFVVIGSLHGGVTKSLALDGHGKTLGSLLMDLDV